MALHDIPQFRFTYLTVASCVDVHSYEQAPYIVLYPYIKRTLLSCKASTFGKIGKILLHHCVVIEAPVLVLYPVDTAQDLGRSLPVYILEEIIKMLAKDMHQALMAHDLVKHGLLYILYALCVGKINEHSAHIHPTT